MALQTEYRYGPLEMELEDSEIRRRRDGLDAGTVKFISNDRFAFPPGSFVPGYGLEVEECSTRQDGDTDFIHSLMVVGIYGARPARRLLGYPQENRVLTGFDSMVDAIITQDRTPYLPGTVMAGQPWMICTESPSALLWTSSGGTKWYHVTPHYQGLLGSKPYKRQITVNEEVVNPEQPIIVTLAGGWDDARKAQVSLPKIMVRDTRVVTDVSPTASIPGNATPDNAPSIQAMSISGPNLVFRWPHNWKIASLDRDEIPGTLVALETINYEFVWPANFG